MARPSCAETHGRLVERSVGGDCRIDDLVESRGQSLVNRALQISAGGLQLPVGNRRVQRSTAILDGLRADLRFEVFGDTRGAEPKQSEA